MDLPATSVESSLDRLGKTACYYGFHCCEEDSIALLAPVDDRWPWRNCSDDLRSACLPGSSPCCYRGPSHSFEYLVLQPAAVLHLSGPFGSAD